MKSKIIALLFVLSCLSNLQAQIREVWMLGPMLHLNFGGEKMRVSYGFEASYWNYQGFPYSFDFGIDLQKGKVRLYSEAQTGVALAGLAAGPVLEYRGIDKKVKLGIQGSVWANFFLGFNMRFRRIGGEGFVCPGAYFKLPSTVFEKNEDDGDNDSDWDWD